MSRITSIDFLRGLVMIIMALDHVRDYTHLESIAWADPTDLATTTPLFFFTRFITHFCAPVFVFLSGTSIYLSAQKRGWIGGQRLFLFKRGLFLVAAECTVVTFGWTFDIFFSVIILQVIWAIGIAMMAMSVLTRFSSKTNLILGIGIILFHNLLDGVTPNGITLDGVSHTFGAALAYVWSAIHVSTSIQLSATHSIFLGYPVLPWIGVMLAGYGIAPYISDNKFLRNVGLALILVFAVVRFSNFYGDPSAWVYASSAQSPQWLFTVMSFVNCTKYPPSLLYICMTLGPALVLMSAFRQNELRYNELHQNELRQNARPSKWFAAVSVFGRVPMFYYLLHIYLAHIVGALLIMLQGFTLHDFMYSGTQSGFPANSGYPLWVTYAAWIFVVTALYPLCVRYDKFKILRKGAWWSRYV
ncbi:MAG: DUF1624 domain-containing protein [Ignavibacteria bacterium]|nr:DUF1624 domain-containing protein [Ignavibacteria bacterium]